MKLIETDAPRDTLCAGCQGLIPAGDPCLRAGQWPRARLYCGEDCATDHQAALRVHRLKDTDLNLLALIEGDARLDPDELRRAKVRLDMMLKGANES